MRNFWLITVLLWTLSIPLHARVDEEQLSIDTLLERLDDVIANKKKYQARRTQRADSLRQIALTSVGQKRYEALRDMYFVYLHFQSDSALSVACWMKRLPEYQTDEHLRIRCMLYESQVYGMMGFYKTATDMLQSVPLDRCDVDDHLYYYNVRHSISGWNAEYAETSAPALAKVQYYEGSLYQDSLLLYETDAINRSIIQSNKDFELGNYKQSIDTLLALDQVLTPEQRIYTYYNLARTYTKVNEPTLHLRYLILTAIHDIRAGITEYKALSMLAGELFDAGDITRAYNYMYCAIEDANACHYNLRTIEVSNIFPIIARTRNERLERQNHENYIIIAGQTLGFILLIVGLVILLRYYRRLYTLRALLAKVNSDLRTANFQLLETNRQLICSNKNMEQYLINYLTQAHDYLSSIEAFQMQMLRLLQAHKLTELSDKLKSTAFIEEEQEKFYAEFDSAFLTIYPNFVEKFNALLRPEAAIIPQKGKLLTTELRIFALIRMGVTDSAKIANFLNYSLTTIYNYRSRVRNNALSDKETFEQRVMSL